MDNKNNSLTESSMKQPSRAGKTEKLLKDLKIKIMTNGKLTKREVQKMVNNKSQKFEKRR